MNPFQISVDDLHLSIEEQKSYPRWYTDLLLRKGKQSVAIGDTLSFVENFGLQETDKQRILSIFGDPLVTLEPAQFYVFIRLTSHLLEGQAINPSLVYLQAPVPKPKSILSRKRKKDIQSPNLSLNQGSNPFRRTNASSEDNKQSSKPQKLDIDSFTKFILTGSMPDSNAKSDYESDDGDKPPPTSRRKKRVTFNSDPPQVAEAAARSMEELIRQKGLQPDVSLYSSGPGSNASSSSSSNAGASSSTSYYAQSNQPDVTQSNQEDDEPDVEIDNTFKNVNIDSVLYHGVSNVTPDNQDHFRFSDVISPSPSPPLYTSSPLQNNQTGNGSSYGLSNMTSIASVAEMMAPPTSGNSGGISSPNRGSTPSPIPFPTIPTSSPTLAPPLPPPPPRPRSDSRPLISSSLASSSITAQQNNNGNVNNDIYKTFVHQNGSNNNNIAQQSNHLTTFHTGSSSSLLNQNVSPLSNSPLSSAPPSISSTPTIPNQPLQPLQPQYTRTRPIPPPIRAMNTGGDLPTIAPPPPQSRRVGSNSSVNSINGTLTNGLSLTPQQRTPSTGSLQPIPTYYTTSPPLSAAVNQFPNQFSAQQTTHAPPLPPRQPSPMYSPPQQQQQQQIGGLAPPPPPSRRRAPSLPPQAPPYRAQNLSPGMSHPSLTVPNGFLPHRAAPLGQQPTNYASSAPDLLADLKALQDEVDRINSQR